MMFFLWGFHPFIDSPGLTPGLLGSQSGFLDDAAWGPQPETNYAMELYEGNSFHGSWCFEKGRKGEKKYKEHDSKIYRFIW